MINVSVIRSFRRNFDESVALPTNMNRMLDKTQIILPSIMHGLALESDLHNEDSIAVENNFPSAHQRELRDRILTSRFGSS